MTPKNKTLADTRGSVDSLLQVVWLLAANGFSDAADACAAACRETWSDARLWQRITGVRPRASAPHAPDGRGEAAAAGR